MNRALGICGTVILVSACSSPSTTSSVESTATGGNMTMGTGGTTALGTNSNVVATGGTVAAATGGTVATTTGGTVATTTGGTGANATGGTGAKATGSTVTTVTGGTGATATGGTGANATGGTGATATGGTGATATGGTGANATGGTGATATGGTGATATGGTGVNATGGTGATATGGTGANATGGTGATTTGGTGATATGGTGATATGGTSSNSTCGVGPTPGAPGFGSPAQTGTGTSTVKYSNGDVTRDGTTYRFITNWWGQGWSSSNVTWSGTSFDVKSAAGTSTPDGTPIGYPTTYCGQYSETAAHGDCGLPVAYTNIDKLWTGWKWHSSDNGEHNAAWDIWLGTSSAFQSYLMVWLRDPAARQPAGNGTIDNVTVSGVPGTWIIKYGTVNGRPIVNYVRPEGQDACEFEFNVMDFVNDAKSRATSTSGLTLPGDTVRAIAVGFEFWTGPFADVSSDDFYVKLIKK